MNYARFLFGFEGRIAPAKFWLGGLIMLCWMLFLAALMFATARLFGAAAPEKFGYNVDEIFRLVDPAWLLGSPSVDPVPLLFKVTGTALFLWVDLAISIKRLHDRDKSGWWMVAFFVIPGLYHQFKDRLGHSDTADLAGLVVFMLAAWGFIEILFLRGTKGPNRFGGDPLAPVDTSPGWDQQSELEFVPHRAGPSP